MILMQGQCRMLPIKGDIQTEIVLPLIIYQNIKTIMLCNTKKIQENETQSDEKSPNSHVVW